jgi:hypothetical protein
VFPDRGNSTYRPGAGFQRAKVAAEKRSFALGSSRNGATRSGTRYPILLPGDQAESGHFYLGITPCLRIMYIMLNSNFMVNIWF